MWEKWEKACQKNVDHYNEHPGQHVAFAIVGAVVGYVGIRALASRMSKPRVRRHTVIPTVES